MLHRSLFKNDNCSILQSKDGAITLLACDFFAVTPEMIGPFDYVYDRGALVALPADVRYGIRKYMHYLSRAEKGLKLQYDTS